MCFLLFKAEGLTQMMLKHIFTINNHVKEHSLQSNSTYGDLIFYHRVVSISIQAELNVNRHACNVFSCTVCEVCSGRSEHSGCPEDSTKVIQACFSVWTP